jgi:hypothetical protein
MNYPGGPDEPWDNTTCANCGCDLPDKDPDPENSGTSPWWDGFCSEPCRKGEPVPPDEDQLKSLDAYGHLNYVVGFSDEASEDAICGCPTVWEPGKPVKAPQYKDGNCTKCNGREDRGDWMACFDAIVWKHPSRGVLVAYHVVVNSDSGGFIDTLKSGVVEADKAPFDLPDYWASIGMEQGLWTKQECEEANECQARWTKVLNKEITQAQGDQS